MNTALSAADPIFSFQEPLKLSINRNTMNPKQNKYSKTYERLMASARGRKLEGVLCEKHHAIPKSLGGNNSKDNIVRLTIREHYVAHLLLTKMYDGKSKRKMFFALKCMVNGFGRQERYKPNSRTFELRRKVLHEETKVPKKAISPEVRATNKQIGAAKMRATIANRTSEENEKIKIKNKLAFLKRKRDWLNSFPESPWPTFENVNVHGGVVLTSELLERLRASHADIATERQSRMLKLDSQIQQCERLHAIQI